MSKKTKIIVSVLSLLFIALAYASINNVDLNDNQEEAAFDDPALSTNVNDIEIEDEEVTFDDPALSSNSDEMGIIDEEGTGFVIPLSGNWTFTGAAGSPLGTGPATLNVSLNGDSIAMSMAGRNLNFTRTVANDSSSFYKTNKMDYEARNENDEEITRKTWFEMTANTEDSIIGNIFYETDELGTQKHTFALTYDGP